MLSLLSVPLCLCFRWCVTIVMILDSKLNFAPHIPAYAEGIALVSIPKSASLLLRSASAQAFPPSLLLCRPSYAPVLCPRLFAGPIGLRPLCDNAEKFLFSGWSINLASIKSFPNCSPRPREVSYSFRPFKHGQYYCQ